MLGENRALQVWTCAVHYPTSNLRVLFSCLMICLYFCQHSCVPGPVLLCWRQEPRNLGMCPPSGHIFTSMKPTWEKAQTPGPGKYSHCCIPHTGGLTKVLPFPSLQSRGSSDPWPLQKAMQTVHCGIQVCWGKRGQHSKGGVWSMMCYQNFANLEDDKDVILFLCLPLWFKSQAVTCRNWDMYPPSVFQTCS